MKKIFILIPLILIWVAFDTSTPLHLDKWKGQIKADINWKNIQSEATEILQGYIKIKSIRGNELEAVNYLSAILNKEGIKTKIIPLPNNPKRAILLAEIQPSQPTKKPGVILASHSDVVEAQAAEWKVDPFAGTLKGNYIYGRGAIDMKGMGVMQLMSFILLKRHKLPIKRKIMFMVLPDEETSGLGAKYMIRLKQQYLSDYRYMLNEGGLGTKDIVVKGSTFFNVQYAEKGIIWLSFKAQGKSGHGSTPYKEYASKNLLNFYQEILAFDHEMIFTPETESMLYQFGTIAPFPKNFFLKRAGNPLIRPLLKGAIESNRHLRALTSHTRSITGLKTNEGIGTNLITPEAYGKMDIRILPNIKAKDYLDKIREVADKYGILVIVNFSRDATKSPINTPFFKAIGSVVQKHVPGSVVTPFMSTGGTDSAFFRQAGFDCYGLIPGIFENKEIEGMHGKNERISQQNLLLGIQVITDLVSNF